MELTSELWTVQYFNNYGLRTGTIYAATREEAEDKATAKYGDDWIAVDLVETENEDCD